MIQQFYRSRSENIRPEQQIGLLFLLLTNFVRGVGIKMPLHILQRFYGKPCLEQREDPHDVCPTSACKLDSLNVEVSEPRTLSSNFVRLRPFSGPVSSSFSNHSFWLKIRPMVAQQLGLPKFESFSPSLKTQMGKKFSFVFFSDI